MEEKELEKLQARIKEKRLKWQAGKTSVSELSPDEQRKRLGLIPGREEMELLYKLGIEKRPPERKKEE